MKIGHGEPARIFWQVAEPWGKEPWGSAGPTVGAWGCPGVSLAVLATLAGDPSATPLTVVQAARKHRPAVWAPGSSLALLPELARSAGFTCPDSSWMTAEGRQLQVESGRMTAAQASKVYAMSAAEMSIEICATIATGGFAWLQVDKNADGKGDHWIGAYAYDDEWIYCADTATARREKLSRKDLTGTAVWSKVEKHYRCVRAYPLTRKH